MQTVHEPASLRAVIRGWRAEGKTVGLVPTMGNLHAGHFSLIRHARARADRVVASIFVNPTQFGPNEDFERYPRTLVQDQAGLADEGCDLLFAPEVSALYPLGPERAVKVHVPRLGEILDGASRPGHFDGVATVVCKLFNLVQPDFAVFGQKDYQQLRVIERMVADLGLTVKVMGAATVRAADGLALSSRNQYLDDRERAVAVEVSATLRQMQALMAGGHAREAVEQAAMARLVQSGFVPDYAVIRRAEDLEIPAPEADLTSLVALVAARLGTTRLIDNLPFSAA
ncbi:pantoate--beta-alanine ligase [Frateuria aurantia]